MACLLQIPDFLIEEEIYSKVRPMFRTMDMMSILCVRRLMNLHQLVLSLATDPSQVGRLDIAAEVSRTTCWVAQFCHWESHTSEDLELAHLNGMWSLIMWSWRYHVPILLRHANIAAVTKLCCPSMRNTRTLTLKQLHGIVIWVIILIGITTLVIFQYPASSWTKWNKNRADCGMWHQKWSEIHDKHTTKSNHNSTGCFLLFSF